MKSALFVAGTDTSVGKTHTAAALVRALRRSGIDAVGYKPLVCGERGDAEKLLEASDGVLTLNEVNPVWFRAPLAPFAASMVEQRLPDLDLVHEGLERLCSRHESVIVEGVGGWHVPVTRELRMSDLVAIWKLPVLLVAADRLGVLNHTLLTHEAVTAARLTCLGVLLNRVSPVDLERDGSPMTNQAVLEMLLPCPVWGPWEHDSSEVPPDVMAALAKLPVGDCVTLEGLVGG